MPTDLHAAFQEAAPSPREPLDVAELLARADRRRVLRRVRVWLTGLAAIGAIGAPIGAALVPAGPSSHEVRTVTPHPTPTGPVPGPLPGGAVAPPSPRPSGPNQVNSSPGQTDLSPGGRAGPQAAQPASAGATPGAAPSLATRGSSDWSIPSGSYPSTINGYATHPGDPTTESMSTDSLAVEAPSGAQQRSVRNLDDTSGATFQFGQTIEHRADGLHLVSFSRVYNSTYVSACQLSAAPLVLPADPKPGYHLHVSVPNCQYYYSGNIRPADLTVDVLGTGTIVIGGTNVPAVEVRVEVAFNGGPTSAQNEDDVDDQWVRPTNGLVLKEHRTDTISAGASANATTGTWGYDATIASTTPLR